MPGSFAYTNTIEIQPEASPFGRLAQTHCFGRIKFGMELERGRQKTAEQQADEGRRYDHST